MNGGAHASLRRFLSQAAYHLLLLAGCVVFATPFFWLVSSSFKDHDEFFATPPVWLPSMPQRVAASPYLEAGADIEAPEGIQAERWARLAPRLLAAVAVRIQALSLPSVSRCAELMPGLVDELARALVRRVVQRAGAEVGTRRADEIVAGIGAAHPVRREVVALLWQPTVEAVRSRPRRSISDLEDLGLPPAPTPAGSPDLWLASWAAGTRVLGGYTWEEELETRFSRPAAWDGLAFSLGGALWTQLQSRYAYDPRRDDDAVIAFVVDHVNADLVGYLWSRTFRGILVGDLEAHYADGTRQLLATPVGPVEGPATGLEVGPDLVHQERTGALLAYRFDGGGISLRLPLTRPLRPHLVQRLVLPVRGDRSYHDLVMTVASDGHLYRAREPFVLDNARWMDAIWTFDEPSLRERRTVYYSANLTSLERVGQVPQEQAWVQLDLERVGYARVLARRLARNYTGAVLAIPFLDYLWNTVIITALNIGASLLSCTLIAYGFSRLRWPGRDALFGLVLATMMLPPQVTMIPQFLIWSGLGQYDTYQPLWLPALFGSGFFVFLMRQFMLGIPTELEDAARIDGCGYLGTLRHVVLPLLKPALAAVGIFQFMGAWNDFLGPLIYLSSEAKSPLSLGLYRFTGSHFVGAVGEVGLLMAASLIMVLPVIALFFSAQRYFVQGVTFTGLKN